MIGTQSLLPNSTLCSGVRWLFSLKLLLIHPQHVMDNHQMHISKPLRFKSPQSPKAQFLNGLKPCLRWMVRWFPTNSIQKKIQIVTTETRHLIKQLSKRNTNLKKRGETTPSETHQTNSLLNRVEQQVPISNGITNSGRHKNSCVFLQEWHNRLLMR